MMGKVYREALSIVTNMRILISDLGQYNPGIQVKHKVSLPILAQTAGVLSMSLNRLKIAILEIHEKKQLEKFIEKK